MNVARAIEGIPVVASATERATLFATPATDQRVYNKETGAIERYDGVSWVTDFSRQTAIPRSSPPLGVIDLPTYGITDYDNPFNVKFYWDGTKVWPLRKVDSTFNYKWRDGTITWVDPTNGDRYMSVSVPKMNDHSIDPALTVNTYFVNYATGTDDLTAGRGASTGNPWKRLSFALTNCVEPCEIKIAQDWVGTDSFASTGAIMTIADGRRVKITGVPPTRKWTYLSAMREAYVQATFAWANVGTGTWECAVAAATISDNLKKGTAQWDLLLLDADGVPMPLKWVPTGVDRATTLASVQAIPGSFSWFGTTGVGLSLFVHLADGRQPDPENWIYTENPNQFNWLIGEASKLVLEKVFRPVKPTANATLAGIRARPIVIDVNNYALHTGQFWMINCGVTGANGPGVQVYDLDRFGWDDFVAKYIQQDGENIHSFYPVSGPAGDHMRAWTQRAKIEYVGPSGFNNEVASGHSNQISSCHEKSRITRLNMVGGYTDGPVLADISGAQSLNIHCETHDPINPDGLVPFVSGSPQSDAWVDGANSKMTFLFSTAKSPASGPVFTATTNGVIAYAEQAGPTDAAVSGGGTVTNLTP